MRIFLSYPTAEREVAEQIHLALRAQGHVVFFDRADLPAGEEYDVRIRQEIERSRLFIFLITSESLREDSYARAELAIAQKNWPHPAGRVLPVLLRPMDLGRLPPYLRSVTLLEPEGHVPAAVADAVHRRAVARRRTTIARSAGVLGIVTLIALGSLQLLDNGLPREVTGSDGATLLLVPEGTFIMGDNEHAPMREVWIDAFYIDRHEVTVARYAHFLEATGEVGNRLQNWPLPANLAETANLPIVGVDWYDADQYCRWAGRRLPSEAEWEKAARGTDARLYPWGDDEPTPDRARFGVSWTLEELETYARGQTVVGSHPAGRSPYGADDMAGNIAEWVADWYKDAYRKGDVRNPRGPGEGDGKVIRGGGYYDPPERLAIARRGYADPSTQLEYLGFRCARNVQPS